MNIFYLDHDVTKCAEYHNDKHTVKMIIEYAQLMSTAHRMLDGEEYYGLTSNNRKIRRWRMNDDDFENGLMKASHINHPSNVWLRSSKENYQWLYQLWVALLDEYTYRYDKIHACQKYNRFLMLTPKNIPNIPFTGPTPAMPDEVKIKNNSLASYRNYYINNKTHLASWKKRPTPEWYIANI